MINRLKKEISKYKIYIKFVFSGATAASVQFVLLFILHGLIGLWIVTATSLAFIAAFLVSFHLQKFWTFRDQSRHRIWRQLMQYLAVGSFNFGLNASAMYWLVEKWHVWYILAQAVVGCLIAVEGFLVYRTYIFKKMPVNEKQNET